MNDREVIEMAKELNRSIEMLGQGLTQWADRTAREINAAFHIEPAETQKAAPSIPKDERGD